MKRIRSLLGAFAVLAVIGGAMVVAAPSAFAGNTVFVNGTSIQAAVNAAAPGTTIIVSPGTYNESVIITTNGIHIRGAFNQPNPVLEGFGVGPDPGCGFCIFPPGGPFSSPPITNIEIDHFTIQNFPDSGILAFSAVGLNFHDNTATDNGGYGIAPFDSSHTQIVNNTVSGSDEAGIYVGDSPNASALVRLNTVTDSGDGIFLRDSAHGTVTENTVTGNCIGILLIDTGSGGPGDVFDWTLVHNTANDNNKKCPGEPPSEENPDGVPPTSGAGIVVLGANHSRMTANTANGNSALVPTETPFTGGLVIASSSLFGGSDPAFIQADNNSLGTLIDPNSIDLFWDNSGTKIVITRNICTTSAISPTLCSQ